jgi:histidinol-phosphate phosphatase family protein
MTAAMIEFDVVIPTIGRPELTRLLAQLATADGPQPQHIFVVDDRRERRRLLLPAGRFPHAVVLPGRAAGPAAARNIGWRAGRAPWVAFLDDDVLPAPDWYAALAADIADAGGAGATQGRIEVPLPRHRRPTDWERNVAGLESARWPTADMAYRRAALAAVGGFDERFPRAYREDADLAARVQAAGYRLARGERVTTHLVRAADRWVSVRLQRGNADDARLRHRYGPRWREITGAGPGRRGRHFLTAGLAVVAVIAALAGQTSLAAVALAGWLVSTAAFAIARIAPGPRTFDEIVTMAATSAAIPLAAAFHWLRGWRNVRRHRRPPPQHRDRPAAVLFDRDGTLVIDVPYNGDPALVQPMPGAGEALSRLRNAGIPTAMVSNQSGVARGLLYPSEVDAVNRRVEELLGPLGPWAVCPHGPEQACACRKPEPGLVREAAAALGVPVEQVVVIGDIGADIAAARAAGARAVLVPTPATRPEEVAAAPEVAPDLPAAVRLLLGDR